MDEKILTPDQVAQILQVHPFTVLKFIKQGKLRASKLGRVYRIRQSDVMRFLDEGEAAAASKSQRKTSPKEAGVSTTQKENQMTIQESVGIPSPVKSQKNKEEHKKENSGEKASEQQVEEKLLEAEETIVDPTVISSSKKQVGKHHHKNPGQDELDHYILD